MRLPSTDVSSMRSPKNILLVEDDVELSYLLTHFLEEKIQGAGVYVANDPYEAINMMSECAFDFLLFDWNLQGRNALETLSEAEKGFDFDPNLPTGWKDKSTPVLILSSAPKEFCGLNRLKYFNYVGHVAKQKGLDQVMDSIHIHYLLTT